MARPPAISRRARSGPLSSPKAPRIAVSGSRRASADPRGPAPGAHAGLGYAQLSLNQPAEADRSLQQAFHMARWDLNLALVLGGLHAQYGRPEDAMRLLREVAASAHDEGMRARAQELIDRLDAATLPGSQRSSRVSRE